MVEPALSADKGPGPRREQVRQRVLAEGYARVEDLARSFGVSVMTMHRDLDALEDEGWLVKIRGGATANPAALVEAGVPQRMASMQSAKRAIAAAAAELLTHGQTVFLDDSTTALALVEHLVARPPMTVGTNFLPAVAALEQDNKIRLHLFGGEFHQLQQACLGLQTVAAIDQMQADLLFMSTTALTGGRCLHRSEETVMVRRAFLRNASHRVLLVDHAKFGRPAPHVLCDVAEFDTVVVDDGVDKDDLRVLRERCADVRVARV